MQLYAVELLQLYVTFCVMTPRNVEALEAYVKFLYDKRQVVVTLTAKLCIEGESGAQGNNWHSEYFRLIVL